MSAKNADKQTLIQSGSLAKGLLVLSLPLMLSNLLRALHDFVDTFFLGRISDSVNAQAAVAIATPITSALLAVPIGLSVGIVAVVSLKLGEGKTADAGRLLGNSLIIGLTLSFVLTAAAYFACPPALPFFADGRPLELAVIYLKIRAFELPAATLFEIYRGGRQAQGDTISPLILSGASVLANIALTYFAVNMGWGIIGAAWITVIVQWAIVPFCLVQSFCSKKYLATKFCELSPNGACMKRLCKVSLPTAASGALAAIGFLFLQFFIRTQGYETVAAFSLCNRITNVLIVPVSALAAVLVTFIAQNEGRGDGARSRRAYSVSRNMALALTVVFAVIIFFARAPLIAMLSNDGGVRAAAGEYMVWALAALPLLGLFQNYCGAYNGYGKTGYTFVLECVRLWLLRLPLVWALTSLLPLGRAGIWYAMMASNIPICVLGFVMLKICTKVKKHKGIYSKSIE